MHGAGEDEISFRGPATVDRRLPDSRSSSHGFNRQASVPHIPEQRACRLGNVLIHSLLTWSSLDRLDTHHR